MKAVLDHIAAKQAVFATHPFFAELKMDRPLEKIASFAPRLAFWVMSFQDILRLNEQMVTGPRLKRIARHHRDEARPRALVPGGHRQADRRPAHHQRPLWPGEHHHAGCRLPAHYGGLPARSDDILRIVLVLVLESTGHVFFGRTAMLTSAVAEQPAEAQVLLGLPPAHRTGPRGVRVADGGRSGPSP